MSGIGDRLVYEAGKEVAALVAVGLRVGGP